MQGIWSYTCPSQDITLIAKWSYFVNHMLIWTCWCGYDLLAARNVDLKTPTKNSIPIPLALSAYSISRYNSVCALRSTQIKSLLHNINSREQQECPPITTFILFIAQLLWPGFCTSSFAGHFQSILNSFESKVVILFSIYCMSLPQ